MGLKDLAGGRTARRSVKSGHPIVDALLPSLTAKGALGGLLGKFTKAEFGSKAHSWIGTGDNEPLEPHEVEQALGADEIHRIAVQAGVSRDDAKSGLAAVIPELVDKLSPQGAVPTGDLAAAAKGLDFSSLLRT